jgi:2-alkyl-3-oxoalkanoate reductase
MDERVSSATKPSVEGHDSPQVFQTRQVALTGATGFIGTKILTCLTTGGWQVRAFYRPKKGRTPPKLSGVEWIAGGLDDETALESLINGVAVVVHCAGAVRGATREDFDKVNEAGAKLVAQVAARQPQLPRFLLISSLAAREPQLSHYAASKFRGELAIKAVSEQMRWSIIRPPAVYGPGDRELLPLFQSIKKGLAPLPGGGRGRFSMLYVDDLAAAVLAWANTDASNEKTFELDDGRPNGYDWGDVLSIGSRVLRNNMPVRRIAIPISLLNFFAAVNFGLAKLLNYSPMLTPGKVREITHSDWVCENNEFAKLVDWSPKFRLERGLACIFDQNNKA